MNAAKLTAARMRAVVINDHSAGMDTLVRVLKSDITSLLADFLVIDRDSVRLSIELGEDGQWRLSMSAVASNVITAGQNRS